MGKYMITNDRELETTLDRITRFQQQVAQLRRNETNPVNYRAAVSGFLAEIDRMQLDVREYFCFLPSEIMGANKQQLVIGKAANQVVGAT
jgi:hypothetical protein